MDHRLLLHGVRCSCSGFVHLASLVHVDHTLEVLLDSINFTHYLPMIALIVINPCIVVADLQRGVAHHFPHALDLLGYFFIVHYANRYHIV